MLPTEALNKLCRFLAQTTAWSDAKLFHSTFCSQTKQPGEDITLSTETLKTETSGKETWTQQVHSLGDHDEISPCEAIYLNVCSPNTLSLWISLWTPEFFIPCSYGLWQSILRHEAQWTPTRQTSKGKYQTCMFTKTYILEYGNTDFYQPVVNLGHLSMLNSMEFMLPCISFLPLLDAWSPSAPQNNFAASTAGWNISVWPACNNGSIQC